MSEFRIWLSILSWAVLAVASAVCAIKLSLWIDPSISSVALALIAIMAVQGAYSIRTIARRLGWARPSYALQTDG